MTLQISKPPPIILTQVYWASVPFFRSRSYSITAGGMSVEAIKDLQRKRNWCPIVTVFIKNGHRLELLDDEALEFHTRWTQYKKQKGIDVCQ